MRGGGLPWEKHERSAAVFCKMQIFCYVLQKNAGCGKIIVAIRFFTLRSLYAVRFAKSLGAEKNSRLFV
jgi:hypothetical protein